MSQQATAQAVETDELEEQPSENVGQALLRHIIAELTAIPHPSIENQSVWSCMREAQQEEIAERLTRRIKFEVRAGFREILAGGMPALDCELKSVKFTGKAVQGTLEIPKHSGHTHDLADFAGNMVIVVLASDLADYFEGMGEIVVHHDQQELDLAGELEETGELLEASDETIAEGEAELEQDAADRVPDNTGAEIPIPSVDELPAHLAHIDPSRIMYLEGRPVELAPDPECSKCQGDGMTAYEDEELDSGVGYQPCSCTVMPEDPR